MRQGFVLTGLVAAALLCASAQVSRAEDHLVGLGSDARRFADEAQEQGFFGGRRLKQAFASASGSGSNVQTSTQTTAGGETTTSGETKTAPPGGTTSSSVSSFAPTGKGGSPAPKPSPPPPPPCTDIPPPLNKYTCAQQKAFGKCKESWMVSNGWCKATCGACKYPPPPPKKASPPPVKPKPAAPAIKTPSSPCVDQDSQTGTTSASASASCVAGK